MALNDREISPRKLTGRIGKDHGYGVSRTLTKHVPGPSEEAEQFHEIHKAQATMKTNAVTALVKVVLSLLFFFLSHMYLSLLR